MTTDTDYAAAEERLERTFTAMALTIPDEPPPFRVDPAIVLEHRRVPRRTVAIAATAAALAAAAAAGLVIATTGNGAGPSIHLNRGPVSPAAPAPADGLVAVPNVVGLPLDQAVEGLGAAGLSATVLSGGSPTNQTGLVLTQVPTGRVAPGATVTLTVAPN